LKEKSNVQQKQKEGEGGVKSRFIHKFRLKLQWWWWR